MKDIDRIRIFARAIFAACLVAFCLAAPTFGQQVASVVHTQYKINSKALGEERTILVRVPANYDRTNAKFPVVYMLDAHPPQNAMMAGIIEQQAWGGVIPEVILVGIQNTNRVRDMTPTVTDQTGTGGGEKFLKYIETEVIPFVEKNYRTQPYRIFAGHSLGGLFVTYALVTRPDLFNAYIAASPVLNWDNDVVLKRAETIFKEDKDWKKTMFVALGDEPEYVDGYNALQDLLKKTKPKNFEFEFQQYKDENHGSVVLRAYYAGLRKIFAGWTPPPRGSVAELELHYRGLSKRFGYEIPIPEAMMNQIGYQFLRADKVGEAIEVFRKNAGTYAESANAFDSLAEAYEKNAQLQLAEENYDKAFAMATAAGRAQLAASAKANAERLRQRRAK
jgi:predicted alpha/beta superfamily hydrolase